MPLLLRLALGLALVAHTLPSHAQLLFTGLPAVPTGGALLVQVTISAPNGAPAANVPITVTARNGCGTINGSNGVEIGTNALGRLSFTFVAASTPGYCTIEGRNGATVGTGTVTVYTPSEVVITADHPVVSTQVNATGFVQLTVTAGDHRLAGLPVEVTAPPASVASATISISRATTSDFGESSFLLNTNGIVGVYDLVVRIGPASRIVRVHQAPAFPTPDPPGTSVRLNQVPLPQGPIRLSIVDPAGACRINSAEWLGGSDSAPNSAGIRSFPLGLVQFDMSGCPSDTARFKLEYPHQIDADLFMVVNAATPTPGVPWLSVPYSVSGNSVTFTADAGGVGPRPPSPTGHVTQAALAKPVPRNARALIPLINDMWWSGPAENGWGMSLAQSSSGNVFAAVYAYDEAGRPTWWTIPGGLWDDTRMKFDGMLYSPYGTPWYAYDPSLTVFNNVAGPAKLTVLDEASIVFDYNIEGVSGRKTLQRQVFGGAGTAPLPYLAGMWWGGFDTAGWGVSIMQQGATLFAVWYTYDELNRPTWFVMPGGRWNGTQYEGRMYRTRGSPWPGRTYDPGRLQVFDVGPYRLEFNAAGAAALHYSVEGRNGTLQLTRQSPF